MTDNPLPKFIKGVFTIAQAFRVFQIFLFPNDQGIRAGHNSHGEGIFPTPTP